jgi:hypothetical protein
LHFCEDKKRRFAEEQETILQMGLILPTVHAGVAMFLL